MGIIALCNEHYKLICLVLDKKEIEMFTVHLPVKCIYPKCDNDADCYIPNTYFYQFYELIILAGNPFAPEPKGVLKI